jgi:hypothetical protein
LGIINNQEELKKKRCEIQTPKVEGRKTTVQQIIAENFNEYFVATTKGIKRQSKNNFIIRNDDDSSIDNQLILWNKPFINHTQI